MNRLNNLVAGLENYVAKQDLTNTTISMSAVGWHIEHSLLTIGQIIDAIKRSDPALYKWKFNFKRTLVLTINKIPRGRAQAPDRVQPKNEFSAETLKEHLEAVRVKINDLHALKPNNYFEHPFFGKLNLKPALRFLGIHTKHHLNIIKDIVGS